MRASFDRLTDWYNGPGTGSPGTIRIPAAPSRLVYDGPFTDTSTPLSNGNYYITIDVDEPYGPTWTLDAGHSYIVDFDQADRVALTEGGPITHYVQRVEIRTWPEGANYWRAHIAPLDPLPPEAKLCVVIYGRQNLNTPDDPMILEQVEIDGTSTDVITCGWTFIGINDAGFPVGSCQIYRNGVHVADTINQWHETPPPIVFEVNEGVCPT